MTYRDLILLKAIFNQKLHLAILDCNYSKIHSIMRNNYKNDLLLHNIDNFFIDFQSLKAEYKNILKTDNFIL